MAKRRFFPLEPFGGGLDFRDFFGPFRALRYMREPLVEMREEGNDVVVNAELPGVAKEDIKLRVTGERIEIRVEKKEKTEEKKRGYYAYSSRFEGYREALGFPSAVDAKRAKATFKNGVLEVRVPKKGAAEGGEIKIA
jgi:HSP20 family protein